MKRAYFAVLLIPVWFYGSGLDATEYAPAHGGWITFPIESVK